MKQELVNSPEFLLLSCLSVGRLPASALPLTSIQVDPNVWPCSVGHPTGLKPSVSWLTDTKLSALFPVVPGPLLSLLTIRLCSPGLQLLGDLSQKGILFPQLHLLGIRTIPSDCLSRPLLIPQLCWNIYPWAPNIYHMEGTACWCRNKTISTCPCHKYIWPIPSCGNKTRNSPLRGLWAKHSSTVFEVSSASLQGSSLPLVLITLWSWPSQLYQLL
jgi:hypothetical protein